jgi:hypothetical protein
MSLGHLISITYVKTTKFLRIVFDAIAEAREHRALIEIQLYRGRYKHSSKLDDDLPIVH